MTHQDAAAEAAAVAYVVAGADPGGGPHAPAAGPPFAGTVEQLRDEVRRRRAPLGVGGTPVPTAPAAGRPHRGRRRGAHLDVTDLLVPELAVTSARGTRALDVPGDAWWREHADVVWQVLASPSFGSRPYVDQPSVLRSLDASRNGRPGAADPSAHWRLLNLELWLREFLDHDPADPDRPPVPLVAPPTPVDASDADGRHAQAPPKSDYAPNAYKRLLTRDGRWARFPLRVDLVSEGDDLAGLVARRAGEFFAGLPAAPEEVRRWAGGEPWFVYVGEKVVAIAQGRYVLVRDLRVGRPARLLSRAVGASPFGIGVSQPETMQVAIDEVGLPRILLAAAAGAAGKVLRRRGWFYRVAGHGVAAIDGPADYCAYPANVSAKLAPRDPDGVARAVTTDVQARLAPELAARFGGTVVIDSNDLGRDVLGTDTGLAPARLAEAYVDNPTGQGREQTPICLVFAQPEPHGTTG